MRYLQRLIERAVGAPAAVAPADVRSPRRDLDDPFERVAAMPMTTPFPSTASPPSVPDARPRPTALAAPPVTVTSERTVANAAAHVTLSTPLPVVVVPLPAPPHTLLAPREPQPSTIASAASPVHEPEPATAEPARAVADPVPPLTLRAPAPDVLTVLERWLAPDPHDAPALPPFRPSVDPARVAPPPAIPAVAPAIRVIEPTAPVAPAPPALADARPALTIGRLVVEVRSAPPAQSPAPVIIRAPAPNASAPTFNILHRGFGLAQS